MRISHIAIAAGQLEPILEKFKALGLQAEHVHDVPTERVRVAMVDVEVSGSFRIELVQPTDSQSPISKFLGSRSGGGLHHICFEVDDIEHWHSVLSGAGLEILSPGIRPAARGRAFFLHPKSMGGVLVEIEQIEP